MGKFLDKTGLQTFLNKLKGMFLNKSGINAVKDDFILELNNLSDTHTVIDKNGISQTNNVDNYYMKLNGGGLLFYALDNTSKSSVLDCTGLIINIDYGIDADGTLRCNTIKEGTNTLIDFVNGIYYENISVHQGEIHFFDKYKEEYFVDREQVHPMIYDYQYEFSGNLNLDTQAFTHFGINELVIGGDDKLGTIITKDVVVASKIAIGNCTGFSEYTITGSPNQALMANGTTANVAILSGKDNNEVPLINQQSFISQDEYVDWSGTYLLLHYPMDVGETTVVHLTISKTNNNNVTRIIEIDTINTNSTIKLVIDNNKTSINFNNVNNKEFSGRYRIYCYSSSNSVVYSKL